MHPSNLSDKSRRVAQSHPHTLMYRLLQQGPQATFACPPYTIPMHEPEGLMGLT